MRNYKKLPICTIAIAAANVLIFLGLSFMGMTEDSAFMMEHGAMYVPYLMNGERYYTLITSMFLHFGFSHLMNNMVMLLIPHSFPDSHQTMPIRDFPSVRFQDK